MASDRFTESAAADGTRLTDAEFRTWFAERREAHAFQVEEIPFARLDGWAFAPHRGLRHDSGRFFTVEGLQVRTDVPGTGSWMQPVINQPEIGVLGILVKEFDGVLHCLMQAKMEPGNVNQVQLSPTVQATRSNYLGVHRGRPVPYLNYFNEPGRGRVLVDSLQSEQGSWFFRKRNRNMVVEALDDVPEHPDFRWLSLGQVRRLLLADNVVNMNARTVLSCIPFGPPPASAGDDPWRDGLRRSLGPEGETGALLSRAEVLSRITAVKALRDVEQRLVPLEAVEGWHITDREIAHDEGRFFRIIAAAVNAGSREVASWTQPLLAPVGRGEAMLPVRRIGGVLHMLLQARTEAGTADVVELAPPVQYNPGNYRELPPSIRQLQAVDPSRTRYDALLSEEGGRFHRAVSRYRIVELPEEQPPAVPADHLWLTPGQVRDLLPYGRLVNIQARTLLACLHATW
ncbi:NDP-hexose 2,3-dehydratase family protein [Streptomyces sp. NPDC001262]|uniref:NDP-hexose 2,3-dehydratase family protein n=1 Tax=Streptomyces sp. NPDC001262 TaxID=3364552 RepID=UPI00367F994E